MGKVINTTYTKNNRFCWVLVMSPTISWKMIIELGENRRRNCNTGAELVAPGGAPVLTRASLPILWELPFACFTCYSSKFLRGKKRSCIRTLNRNKNVQEILRIGQKPAKTEIYKSAAANKIRLPRTGGGGGDGPAPPEGPAVRIPFRPLTGFRKATESF